MECPNSIYLVSGGTIPFGEEYRFDESLFCIELNGDKTFIPYSAIIKIDIKGNN